MSYQEAQGKPEEKVTYPQEPSYMKVTKPHKPYTQHSTSQPEKMINPTAKNKNQSNSLSPLIAILVVLLPILGVAAIYYGLFNP
ncbi:MAG: hypothetical protein KME13_04555 [Myxacorys californica WJT36-NPBG1]|jgi:uncharacterized protein HemX|nr:hypothetical protein [Myxacorys californica WJT36-NPBG1]